MKSYFWCAAICMTTTAFTSQVRVTWLYHITCLFLNKLKVFLRSALTKLHVITYSITLSSIYWLSDSCMLLPVAIALKLWWKQIWYSASAAAKLWIHDDKLTHSNFPTPQIIFFQHCNITCLNNETPLILLFFHGIILLYLSECLRSNWLTWLPTK